MVEELVKRTGKTEETVEITEVTTATEPAFKVPEGDILSGTEYLAWLGRQIWEIKKSVA